MERPAQLGSASLGVSAPLASLLWTLVGPTLDSVFFLRLGGAPRSSMRLSAKQVGSTLTASKEVLWRILASTFSGCKKTRRGLLRLERGCVTSPFRRCTGDDSLGTSFAPIRSNAEASGGVLSLDLHY